MKKIIIITLALVLTIGLLLAGCTPEAQQKLKEAINNATVELAVGETYQFTPTFYNEDSEGNKTAISYQPGEVTFESSSPESVSVSSSGVITGVTAGGAFITAYYHKGQEDSKSASLIITVYYAGMTIPVGGSSSWDALSQIISNAGESSTVDFTTGTVTYSQGAGKGKVTLIESSRGVVTITGSSAGFVTVNASYSGGGSASIVVKVS